MTGPTQLPARRFRSLVTRRNVVVRGTGLMVIDHGRLQAAAWAEFHTACKRLEKATRELHRHEATDMPAYESWLHRTFPLLVTALRELHEEAATKARKIEEVQARAAFLGGSLMSRITRA